MKAARRTRRLVLVERINEVYRGIFGPVTDYDKIKRNLMSLCYRWSPDIRAAMAAGEDPLHTGVLSMRGLPIILISGMASSVDKGDAFQLLNEAAQDRMDEQVYARLLDDFGKGG